MPEGGTSEFGRRRFTVPGTRQREESLVGRPGVGQALSAALGIAGGGLPLRVLPTLQPVIALTLAEAEAPTGPYQAQGQAFAGPVAAQFSTIGVRNVATSQVDLHLEWYIDGSNTAATMIALMLFRSPQTAAAPAPGQAILRDDPTHAPIGVMIEDTLAALLGAPHAGVTNVSTGQHGAGLPLEGWILPPGSDFIIQANTANQNLHGTFWWREIPREA